jgi:hypothetical protein
MGQNEESKRNERARQAVATDKVELQAAPRMQQLLHGIRLAASDDLSPAQDLQRLAELIQSGCAEAHRTSRHCDKRRRAG